MRTFSWRDTGLGGDRLEKNLVVEDETVIRDAVSAYLEREQNYTVRGVHDGQSVVVSHSGVHHLTSLILI